MSIMCFDPFRDLDRLTQLFTQQGGTARLVAMPAEPRSGRLVPGGGRRSWTPPTPMTRYLVARSRRSNAMRMRSHS
jgi:hypothetical protein